MNSSALQTAAKAIAREMFPNTPWDELFTGTQAMCSKLARVAFESQLPMTAELRCAMIDGFDAAADEQCRSRRSSRR